MTPIYTGQRNSEPAWLKTQGRMRMITGQDFLDLAATRIGEEYVYGAEVDLGDSDWHGPWDCAEFCSWAANQIVKKLYGCLMDPPHRPDPWTGAWARDVKNGTVTAIPIKQATKTPGALLLRYRQGGHHIVFSVGDGRTLGAQNSDDGVCYKPVGSLNSWDYGILIPDVKYEGV